MIDSGPVGLDHGERRRATRHLLHNGAKLQKRLLDPQLKRFELSENLVLTSFQLGNRQVRISEGALHATAGWEAGAGYAVGGDPVRAQKARSTAGGPPLDACYDPVGLGKCG